MDRYHRKAEEIAALPQQRRLGWLCDWLQTTPADPRVLDLTEEQMHDLWLQFCHFHPDRVKQGQTIEDPEYDDYERQVAEESQGVLYETTRIIPHGEEAPVFVTAPPDEWEDVP